MKKILFSLSYLFIFSIFSLTAQSYPIVESHFSNTTLVNQEKEQHAATNKVFPAKSAFKLNAFTNSGKALFYQVVCDLNNDGKISQSEWLTEPLPSDAKGNLRSQVLEINPKIVDELNKRSYPTKAYIRAALDSETLLSSVIERNRKASSLSFYFGQASPYIMELLVNDNFIKNSEAAQHFTSEQIVTIDGNILTLNAIVNTEGQERLFGVLLIDLNRDGKIDPRTEIINQPLVAEEGIFNGEIFLPDDILELLFQADEPFPMIFKVSEDIEALYSTGYTDSNSTSILFRAIGPVVVADDEEADEIRDGNREKNCIMSGDSIKNIRIFNFRTKGIKITKIATPSIPTPPAISPTLPTVIDVASVASFELKYDAPFESYFPYDSLALCMDFPIAFEYVEIEKIVFMDEEEDPYLDTIYSENAVLILDTLSLCYCEETEIDSSPLVSFRILLDDNLDNNIQEIRSTPNPVINYFTIDYTLHIDSKVSIDLINSRGAIIKNLKNKSYLSKGRYLEEFDLSEMPSGIYFIRLYKENTSSILKVVKF